MIVGGDDCFEAFIAAAPNLSEEEKKVVRSLIFTPHRTAKQQAYLAGLFRKGFEDRGLDYDSYALQEIG